MIAYIAGKITGEKDYKNKFAAAEEQLQKAGFIVLNHASLPEGMSSNKYMPICLAMIEASDVVFFLKDWTRSKGALIEHNYSIYQNKKISYL